MIKEMGQVNETARSHIQRDTEAGGAWTCDCMECREVRSLVGIDKVLAIWSSVKELSAAEEQLDQLPEGPEKQNLWDRYLVLLDRLAATVAG